MTISPASDSKDGLVLQPVFHGQSFDPGEVPVIQSGQNETVRLGRGRNDEVQVRAGIMVEPLH